MTGYCPWVHKESDTTEWLTFSPLYPESISTSIFYWLQSAYSLKGWFYLDPVGLELFKVLCHPRTYHLFLFLSFIQPVSIHWASAVCLWLPSGVRYSSAAFRPHTSGFPGGAVVRNSLPMQETWVWALAQEDPWSRKWQPTPVFLSAKIPWTEEPGGLYSRRSQIDMTEHYACNYYSSSVPEILP